MNIIFRNNEFTKIQYEFSFTTPFSYQMLRDASKTKESLKPWLGEVKILQKISKTKKGGRESHLQKILRILGVKKYESRFKSRKRKRSLIGTTFTWGNIWKNVKVSMILAFLLDSL